MLLYWTHSTYIILAYLNAVSCLYAISIVTFSTIKVTVLSKGCPKKVSILNCLKQGYFSSDLKVLKLVFKPVMVPLTDFWPFGL